MRRTSNCLRLICFGVLAASAISAQEADMGAAIPITLSALATDTHRADASGPGSPVSAAFRAMFYPTIKLGEHWFAYGTFDLNSTPYFYDQLSSRAHSVNGHLIQAYLGYRVSSQGRSLTIKAGQLASAFGAFPLRYDDARNWLVDSPWSYGYYYSPVSLFGLPGVEADAVVGKWDARLQLTNSNPMNPQRLWHSDQYPNWTGGAGYTIAQGFRVGVSAMRGPYLSRTFPYYFPGEDLPKRLPATAYGADVQWGRGRWNVNGEAQRFRYAYHALPDFFITIAYTEAKVNLSPRLYLAERVTARWQRPFGGSDQAFEIAAGFRPASNQLIKLSYEALRGATHPGTLGNVAAVQYVFTLNPPAIAFR